MENYNKAFDRKQGGDKCCKDHSSNSRMIIGLLLVFAGVVLLAENLDFLPYSFSHVLVSWPMILIVLGIFNLVRRSVTAGLILLTIGSYFLAPRIFDLPFNFFHNFWPILLVVVGLIFILQWKRTPDVVLRTDQNKNDTIDETAIFGGRNVSVVSENFLGGKVTSIFGGSNINLLYSKPAPGCVIDVANIFGGSKLIVPEDWNIKVEVTSIFGGFDDKRSSSVISRSDVSKIVVIKGVTIFGGGEITTMP
jgi:predicted membrane protein